MKRLVVIERPPFSAYDWTHVAITWSGLDRPNGTASLFVNGKRIGPAKQIREVFEWDTARVAIRLGVSYTGLMDELAAFDRALTDAEIVTLYDTARLR